MSGLERIQIIYSQDSFKQLKEVFEKLAKERKLGIYNDKFYSVGTSFMFRKVDTEDKKLFNETQKKSKEEGYIRNIYSFKM